MNNQDNSIFVQALNETMAKIKEGTPSGVKHRVTLGGKIKALGTEWELRKYLKNNWTRLEGGGERFVSPCGKFRSLVIDTGCVMITTWPATPGSKVFVTRKTRGGCTSGNWEQDK